MYCPDAEAGMIKGKEDILEPREITKRELQMVHTEEYLESLTVIYPQHDPKDHFTTGSLPIIVQYECGNGSRGPSGSHSTKLCCAKQATETVPLPNCWHHHG